MAMERTPLERAEARYQFRSALALVSYAIVLVFGVLYGTSAALTVRVAFAIGTLLPFIWLAWEFSVYVRALDEMQRLVQMQSAAIGFGATLILATVWGLGETFGVLPDLSPVFALPAAAVLSSLVRFIQNRRLDEE